ncbi:Rha family transcriptional regulator [Acinetobacter vivianii]|uniref:Rha family transcriptional regulator n=1 Tax=Acinetobacter vivianii TaxID=1776742 RepID=A0AAJ6NH89_9GAMM|nr:Rha family transcriptional regulator [Acinetobacter vivianii]WDZ50172.1 Rha family transcriptional regulator [Acinetobacter vivianii]
MNMMAKLNLRAVVTQENGEVKTTSYAVADAFGKKHYNVLRDIEKLRCSENFRKLNFEVCYENNGLQNGKPRKFYRMTKDGWMFLVMGFTGEKADLIKEQFIEAFNWMAQQLTQTFQSKWARYNQMCLEYKTRKEQVSCSARNMRYWQDDKPVFENELNKLENELSQQLQLV